MGKTTQRTHTRVWIGLMSVLAIVGCAGLIGWHLQATPKDAVSPPIPATDEYSGTIIFSLANRDDCRQYNLDNASGRMQNTGKSSCKVETPGSRVEEISNSFRGK